MSKPIAQRSVLYVEDDSALRYAFARRLREIGVRVQEASDSAEAITYLHDHSYDVAVIDMILPERTRSEHVLSYLAQMPKESRPLIILVTGYPQELVGTQNIDVVSLVAFKPVDADSLHSYVMTALAERAR